mgnify:CR=1 FL=1
MNIKKELIKAGFKDQTSLTNDEEINFELWHDLPQSELGIASIRLRNFKGQNDVDITIYSDSGYELLEGNAQMEEAND